MPVFDYKSLTKKDLGYIFDGMSFKTEPMWHQLVAMAFASDKPRVNLFFDVGTGKTLAALLIMNRVWHCKKTLVVCPPSAINSWRDNISNHTSLSHTVLIGDRDGRFENLETDRDVYVINYEGLKTVFGKFTRANDSKGEWVIDQSKFKWDFDCVVFDEVHRCKTYNAIQSQICFELSKRTNHAIGLSGTPVDNSLLDIFNVQKVIDIGASLGINFFAYRTRYFVKYGFNWKVKNKACKTEILDRLSQSVLSFNREECFDLPEIQEIVKTVEPSDEFLEMQDAIINGKTLSFGGDNTLFADADKPSNIGIKLKELASGFVYTNGKDPTTGDNIKIAHWLKTNPKLTSLLSFIESTTSKIIVFYQFLSEREALEAAFKSNRIKFVSLFGGQKLQDRQQYIDDFKNDPKIQVMLAHPACASEGFDGFVANVVVFFDVVVSPKIRTQCIGRIQRRGQKKNCLVIDLVLERSIDQQLIKNRGRRRNFVESVMEYIRGYKHG
jgi:SNF2 family DNA or RNA helicase